jgi:hypothetical protein
MTDDPSLEISPEAPTNSEGHPVHPDPDKSHRICAATKSEKTTPTEHGRERDDVPYCTLAAGWGVEDLSEGPCKHHSGAIDNRGKNNGNYEDGAFSEYFEDDMSEREVDAVNDHADTLAGDDNTAKKEEMARIAAKTFTKFQRTGDHRFLREYRQLCSEFNLVDATQHVAVDDAEAWRQYLDGSGPQ